VEIKEEFEAMKPQVIELHQPMSPAMTEIQTAIIESMDATLAEVRRGNTNVCQLGYPFCVHFSFSLFFVT
jgi:DNA excision repair protein ERCC-4